MKKKMYCLCVLMAAILLCAGCRTRNDKPDNTDNSVENTTESSEYETGAQLDPQTPLMELSDNLLEENYELVYAGMKSNSELIAVLVKADSGEIILKSYDVLKGKMLKKVKSAFKNTVLPENIRVYYYGEDRIFVNDTVNNIYLVFNNKFELKNTIELGENAAFDFVTSDSSRIVYIEDDTNKVYSYNVEAKSKSLVYQFDNNYQVLQTVGMTDDMNHLVYKYVNSSTANTGYADIQMEEHSAEYKENISYTIGISGNEYVYYNYWKSANQICFYSLDKPREIKMFELDSEKELENIVYISDTPYFFTGVKKSEKDGKTEMECKLYDKSQGVLVEKMSYKTDGSAVLQYVTMSPDTELVCITQKRSDGMSVFMWNLKVPSGAIEENEPIEL